MPKQVIAMPSLLLYKSFFIRLTSFHSLGFSLPNHFQISITGLLQMLYAHISCLQNTCPSLIRKQGRDGRFCYLASNAKMDAFTTLQAVHSRSTLRFLRNTLPGTFAKSLLGTNPKPRRTHFVRLRVFIKR